MPILKNVLGLDLGSHSLKAVEFQQTLRGLEAVQLRMLPRSDDDAPLGDLVERFVQLHQLATEHVVSALPGDRISTRRLQFPFRERRRLAQAVPFEVEADLPFDLDQFLVDWEVVGGDRAHAEVIAAVAPRHEVSSCLEMLRAAGCEPHTLEAEGLVLGNLASAFELPGARLLADLGHRKSTFCLLLEGQAVAARTVPVGGRALTEALARDRGLSLEDAERAKCEEGVLGSGPIATASESAAVLDRLAREIVRTLGSLEAVVASHGADRAPEITLLGGTAQLDRIDQFLAERTGLPTSRLGLPAEGHGAGLVAGGPPLLFGPATALALRGTARARTRMNFRRDEFAVRLDLGRFRRDFGWTGVLASVAHLYSEALPGASAPSGALAALREAVRSANERAEFLGVYRGNLSALDLLTEISKHVPADLDIVFEELSIDHQTIRMRVYARSFEAADRLGSELAKFAPFSQVRIGAIETDKKRGGKRFNVTIGLSASEERA
jgi:general secretion pathway protein L